MTQQWMKIGAVARELGLSVSTVRLMTTRGELPCVTTPGGTRLFDPEVIERKAMEMRALARKERHA